jgi:SpoVK/Ycf46/Vps4 family AAA+-type ATPase
MEAKVQSTLSPYTVAFYERFSPERPELDITKYVYDTTQQLLYRKALEEELVKAERAQNKKLTNEIMLAMYTERDLAKASGQAPPTSGSDKQEVDTSACTPLTNLGVSFADIAGAETEKAKLYTTFIYPIEYPGLFQRAPAGLLLYGPPGTGKTLLAKAAASELSHVAFFAPSPGSIKGKFTGETEKNIDAIFDCVEAYVEKHGKSKAIIFFDEMENIAGVRTAENPSMTASVTTLLQRMDGVLSSSSKIVVIGATNFPRQLDTAILRRFSNQVLVDLPWYASREFLIEMNLVSQYGLYPGGKSVPESVRPPKFLCWPKKGSKAKDGRDCQMWQMIKKYGRKTRKGGKLKGCPDPSLDRALKKEDLAMFSTIMGPDQHAEPIIGATRRDLDTYSPLARSKFGYSASDVAKVVDQAINFAASRVIANPSSSWVQEKKIGTEKFLVYLPDVTGSAGPPGAKRLSALSEEDRKRVVTFDITPLDFCGAIAAYPSTVNDTEYVDLLDYAGYIKKVPKA